MDRESGKSRSENRDGEDRTGAITGRNSKRRLRRRRPYVEDERRHRETNQEGWQCSNHKQNRVKCEVLVSIEVQPGSYSGQDGTNEDVQCERKEESG